ncbi:hypothetical protein D3C80_1696860 [compost metagenome]
MSRLLAMLMWLPLPLGSGVRMLGPACAKRNRSGLRKVTARTSCWSSASLAMCCSTDWLPCARAEAESGASCSAISWPRSISWARRSDSCTQVK